jgi:hypothetical protein
MAAAAYFVLVQVNNSLVLLNVDIRISKLTYCTGVLIDKQFRAALIYATPSIQISRPHV